MSAIARVRARITALYGGLDLESAHGVVHIAAVYAEKNDAWRVLRIGPAAPKSATDGFTLMLARARADAILTTGKILRDEPALRYDLGVHAADLSAWREGVLELAEPPVVLVLTRGAGLDLEHPALHGWAEPIVVTGPEVSARVAQQGVRAVGLHDLSLRGAIAWARAELGARTISIEAGPSTAVALYEPPPVVDELMLSVFEGPAVAPEARGRPFVSRTRVEAVLGPPQGGTRVLEPSGPWRFWRFGNKPAPGAVRS